jgi:hypothetical protein
MAIPAIVGGGLMVGGLLGRAFSNRKKSRFGDFDPDPDGLALKQFEMYNDPNSQFYKQGEGAIRRTIADTQPTTSSLLGASMAHGGGYGGSQAIANAQRQAHINRAMDYGTTSLVDFYMKGQSMANQALGMHFANKQSQIGGYQNYKMQRQIDNNSLWGEFMSAGSGLLGMWAGNKLTPQSNTGRVGLSGVQLNRKPKYNLNTKTWGWE